MPDRIFSVVSIDELLDTVVELAIHSIRAEAFGIYLLDGQSGEDRAVVSEAIELAALPPIHMGQGLPSRSGSRRCW